jgi:hypothetical protein
MLTNPIWVVKTRVFATASRDQTAYRGLWGASEFEPEDQRSHRCPLDGLRSVYRAEGMRGLYKGSLLTLAGTANGSIQFATYEEMKRRRAEMKRKHYLASGREWRTEDEKLVSLLSPVWCCPALTDSYSPIPNTSLLLARPSSSPSLSPTPIKSSEREYKTPRPHPAHRRYGSPM